MYVIYDTETTGDNPRFDQILQFAAIYTDDDFNELAHINIRSRLLPHIVPSPAALLVTRLEPSRLATGWTYYDFARTIHQQLSEWSPACFLTYNGLSFDEEILRQAFWQNLFDPYLTNTRGSNRLDLLPLVQLAVAADPGLLQVRTTENGNPSFKLEALAQDNGFDQHEAHDALGDVRATAHLARIVRSRAPRVWAQMMHLTNPATVQAMLADEKAVRYVTHFGKARVHEVTRITSCPSNGKEIAVFDLAYDPARYLDLDAEALVALMTKGEERPIRRIKANKQPALLPIDSPILPPAEPVPPELREARVAQIRSAPGFADRVAEALERRIESFAASPHLEDQIYNGFPTRSDRRNMERFHETEDWNERYQIACNFEDRRLKSLALRLFYCNAPEILIASKRDVITRAVIEHRILATGDVPWTTLEKARASLAKYEGHPDLPMIRAWLDAYGEDVARRLAALTAAAEASAAEACAAESPRPGNEPI